MVNEVWFVERLIDGNWRPCMDTGTISEQYAKIHLSTLTNCGTKDADKYRLQGYVARTDYAALEASIHEQAVTGDHNLIPSYQAEIEQLRNALNSTGDDLHGLWLADRGEMIKAVEKASALEAERAQLNTIVIGLKMEMDKLEAECKRLKAECAQLECDLDFLHNQIASGS